MYELRGLVGGKIQGEGAGLMEAYAGFGYRYLNDDDPKLLHSFNGSTILGYERESNYYYIPVGVDFYTNLENDWKLRFNFEYEYLLWGKQVSHLSDANRFLFNPSTDLENDQETGFGIRTSFLFSKEYRYFDFLFEPFFRFWSIDDSEVSNGTFNGVSITGLEPKNKTYEIGSKIGLRF